jgi:hypothetical protein
MTDKPTPYEDTPMPQQIHCCAHGAQCEVHQPPHDGTMTNCTCTEGTRRYRHRRQVPDVGLVPANKTMQ